MGKDRPAADNRIPEKRKAVFLDRDGVLVDNSRDYYLWKKEDLRLNPGVTGLLSTLKQQGYLLVVVSNQGGISKGIYTRPDVARFHLELQRQLAGDGAGVDAYYYCPHHDSVENCLCRKPLPLLIEKAMARFGIDPAESWMVGDSQRDIQAGRAAGLRTIRVPSNGDGLEILQAILPNSVGE